MNTGLEYLDCANAVTVEDALRWGFKGENESNTAIAEGLYRIGSLVAFGDGAAEYSDIEQFATIGDAGGRVQSVYASIPTTDFIEGHLIYFDHDARDVLLDLKGVSEISDKWSHACRTKDGSWVTFSLYVNLAHTDDPNMRDAFGLLGDIAAYMQSRYVVALPLNGDTPVVSGTLYQLFWHQLSTAHKKRRPSMCRNCGRLHVSHNARGNIATTCSPECTTAYNNEKKRLARIHGKDDYPLNSDLDTLARRVHERRPLQFPGKPEGVE
ncbi:MAG: hypothetical protein LBK67_04950 [Coriobacteriales bacterium]|jgi:hypothetical protein|nr:hypothetical protein [Coriobacteriales bacterium]